MRIAIGADHAGFHLKKQIVEYLKQKQNIVLDFGTYDADPVDYPDYAESVGQAILRGDSDRGILICGSGVGASIAANKLPGIRAALCHDTYSARQSVEDDDANVLCLGPRVIGTNLAIVVAWLAATFSGERRHRRRIGKIRQLEHPGTRPLDRPFDLEPQEKEKSLVSDQVSFKVFNLGKYQTQVHERLRNWRINQFGRRLWAKDPTLWTSEPVPEITDRMGWLHLPDTMLEQIDQINSFAEEVKSECFHYVLLLGMGGSSLAPEVFQATFGNAPGYPEMIVLDSTHPEAMRSVQARVDLQRALFLVSSKSGTTTETLSLFYYFWQELSRGRSEARGSHFVAITDPGTYLDRLARERGFRTVFYGQPDVGGRYSALSSFGLVPASLVGIDTYQLLERASRFSQACSPYCPDEENPGLVLGAILGELGQHGWDKLTFLASDSIRAFSEWAEQLIAESTGKEGKGIIPVVNEKPGPLKSYMSDRLFVYLRFDGDDNTKLDLLAEELKCDGHPVIRISISEKSQLAQEFLRWELAVAAAGAVMNIHPFNQPDVQLAKQLAQEAMEKQGNRIEKDFIAEPVGAVRNEKFERLINNFFAEIKPGDYLAIQAYLAPAQVTTEALRRLREVLRDKLRVATTLGYGPRFLHSTGQLHKGGPNTGLFLQLVDNPAAGLSVPETNYTFGELIQAQAVGDFKALRARNRRVLRVSLGSDVAGGLEILSDLFRGETPLEFSRRD